MPKSPITSKQEPRSVTRQERVQRKEDLIIEAARTMFMDSGFNGTTMAQIARASGVADGTLYTYFHNKEALARAVVTDFYGRLTRTAQDGVDTQVSIEARLLFLARHHLTNVIKERGVLALMPLIDMNLEAYKDSELFGLNKNYVSIFDRVIRDGQAQGAVSSAFTLWVLRDIFFGSLDYGSRTMLIKGRMAKLDEFAEQITRVILAPNSETAPSKMQKVTQRLERAADRMEALVEGYSK